MFRHLIRPECLFLIGTLQALLPYALWHASELNASYYYRLSYIPVLLYCLGYLSFVLGARMPPVPRAVPQFSCLSALNVHSLPRIMFVLCAVAAFSIFGVVRAYGRVPLLAFLSGDANVIDTDASIAESSSLGQMAFMNIVLFLLAACVLLTLLVRLRKGQRSLFSWQLVLPCAILVIGSTMSGKRQSIVLMGVFIGTGLIVYSNSVFSFLLQGFCIRTFLGRSVAYVTAIIAALSLFNYVGMMRSERDASFGISEAIFYLEQPLINLEYQCELAGFGPGDDAPAAILANLVPNRWNQFFPDWAVLQYEPPPRLERTSPTGFYGDLHWYLGLPGVLLFPFFAGWACRYCFTKAFQSIFFLFCYCQIAWPLLSCHSYNHFVNLPFVPLPIIAFIFLATCLQLGGRHAKSLGSAAAQPKSPIQLHPSRAQLVG